MLEPYSVAQVRRWLQLALEALGEAERAFDPEIQAGLRSIADDYLSLAKHAEAKLLAKTLNGRCAKTAAGNGQVLTTGV